MRRPEAICLSILLARLPSHHGRPTPSRAWANAKPTPDPESTTDWSDLHLALFLRTPSPWCMRSPKSDPSGINRRNRRQTVLRTTAWSLNWHPPCVHFLAVPTESASRLYAFSGANAYTRSLLDGSEPSPTSSTVAQPVATDAAELSGPWRPNSSRAPQDSL